MRLLGEALRVCGDYTGEQLRAACLLESDSHYQIWRGEHRTLSTEERVSRILANLEASLPDEARLKIISNYEENILERPPVLIDGVREALEELAGRYKIGLISDVGFSPGRVLRQVLEQNNLLGVFDSLVFSDEAGRSKPHAEVFNRTARRLETDPDEMVHIGDLEFTDIVGAKQAGYRAIRFTGITPMDEGESTVADYVTSDFSNVPRLIENL